MDTVQKLAEISSRLEHIENAAEWIAKQTVHTDNALSQTGTLICAVADDLRERMYNLVRELEKYNYYRNTYH
ncbi:MAG: hypothetical protein D6719_01670 [Candidatus Dadabacteria bacterium]|nr:MAG: hypothetical protein D6719_01670 [Candidatus Dadabacteria bacterium]